MADELPTIRPSPIVTSEAPTPRISGAEVAQPYEELGRAFQKVGDAAEAIAVPLAKRQAAEDLLQQKVTRNADGSINVTQPETSPLMFGEAGKAYHDAIAAGTMAQWRNALSQRFAEIHQDFPADPTGFKNATDSFLSTAANNAPPQIQRAVQSEAAQLQTQHYNAITDRAATIGVELQKSAIMAQIQDQRDTAIGLARRGGTYTPEFGEARDRLNQSYDALASNPLFKTTPDQIAIEKKNAAALLQGEAVVAHVDDSFTRKGKGEAQAQLERDVLQNPNLREVDRDRLYHQGLARLQFLTADAKSTIDANRAITTEMEKTLADGKLKAEDPAVGIALQRSLTIGDVEGAQRITAAAAIQQHLRGINTLPDAVRSQAFGTGFVSYKDRVRQIESGGKPFAVSPTGAAGDYQFTPATWQQYGGGGDVFGNQEAAMDRLTADNERALTQSLGRMPSPGELYLAHQQGAAGAAKLLTNPNARAGSLVGDQAIKVNGGDPNAPAAAFTNMWTLRFEHGGVFRPMPAGVTVVSSLNGGPGFTAEDVQRNPFLLSAYVRSLAADPELRVQSAKQAAEAISKSIGMGIAPPVNAVAEVEQAAAMYPEKVGRIADEMHGALLGQQAVTLPQEQRDRYEQQIRDAANGQDLHQINIAAAAQAQIKKQDENLREHPLLEGANRGWIPQPPMIDATKPETIAPALAMRARLSTRMAGINNMPPPPLIDKDEMPRMQAALQGQAGPQILTSIAQTLKPDEMQPLLREEPFRAAVTGMSRSGDPAKMNAAYSFMDTLQRQNPLQFDAQFKDGLKDLRAWQSNLSFYPPDVAAKRLMQSYDPAETSGRDAVKKPSTKRDQSIAGQVVSKFSTGIIFGTSAQAPIAEQAGIAAGALKADYDKNYRDGFISTGDPAAAENFAMEKLKLKYDVSATNGNRVMAFPPERYYPPVGGTYDWMQTQLDEAVRAQLKATPIEPVLAAGFQRFPARKPKDNDNTKRIVRWCLMR